MPETAALPRLPAASDGAHGVPQQALLVPPACVVATATAACFMYRLSSLSRASRNPIFKRPPPPLVAAGWRGGGGRSAARGAGARPGGLCVGRADAPDPGEAQRGGGAAVRRGRGGRRRRLRRRRRGRRRVRRRGRRRRGRRARQLAIGVVAPGADAPHQQRVAAALGVRAPVGGRRPAVGAAAQGAHAVRAVAGGARGGPHRQGGAQLRERGRRHVGQRARLGCPPAAASGVDDPSQRVDAISPSPLHAPALYQLARRCSPSRC